MLYIVAAVICFVEVIKPSVIPHAALLALMFVAIGLACGGPAWGFWKKQA